MKRTSPGSNHRLPIARRVAVRCALALACVSAAGCMTVEGLRQPERLTALTLDAPLAKVYPLLLDNARYCDTPYARGNLSATDASIVVHVQYNTGLDHDWVLDLSELGDGTTHLDLYAFSPVERRELGARFRMVVASGDFRQCKAAP